MKTMKKPSPDPMRVSLAAKFEEVEKGDAGWTFRMWAQFYNVVNDRVMLFLPKSFRKTNALRVPANKVKIHDGHNMLMDVAGTVGRVLNATESNKGNRYQGFISKSHEDVAQKLYDGTISENSVEVIVTKAKIVERPIDEIPEELRPWVDITPDGTALVRAVQEVKWIAVGLVSASSQDMGALIDAPSVVTFQDLPVALSRWDAAGAAVRVAARAKLAADGSLVMLSKAHLVQLPGGECFGQIADVDENGRLVVVAEALGSAYANLAGELSGRLGDREAAITLALAAKHIGRYGEAQLNALPPSVEAPTDSDSDAAMEPVEAEASVVEVVELAAVSANLESAVAEDPENSTEALTEVDESGITESLGADAPQKAPRTESLEDSTHSEVGHDEAGESLKRLTGKLQLQRLAARARRGVSTNVTARAGREPAPRRS